MVYMFQYDSTHGKFYGTCTAKTKKGKLVINRKVFSICQEQDPANTKQVMLVLRRQGFT